MDLQKVARFALLALVLALAWSIVSARSTYDVVIRNGLIVDGSGNPGYHADLAINDGKIAAIGVGLGPASKEIDAKGRVVCPGFIDVHTHAENVVLLPRAENFLRMGVTTIVVGNCGSSEVDIGSFLNRLESKPVSPNVASLIGHNAIRRAAMGGSFDRRPSRSESTAMAEMVDRGMKNGAVGLSTGLIYLPGSFSSSEEIIELAKVAARYGGIYASHMRNESVRIDSAIDELLRVAREAKIRVELSHIKLGGESMWGKADAILAKLEAARSSGIEITQDQYAYTASSTSLSVLIPDAYLEGGPDAYRKRMEDTKLRTKAGNEMKAVLSKRGGTDYAYAVISSCRSDKRLNGKNVKEATQQRVGKSDLDSQIKFILDLQLDGGASAVFHGMSENDVRTFMQHPNTMIASDASCRDLGEDVPHPRGYGNNARVLGLYVRELKILRLEDAVRKMTSLPAQSFCLKGRGVLAEGAAADIVVFDLPTVGEMATYTNPHQLAKGFQSVLVNGVETVRNDEHTGMRAGRPLRGAGFEPK